MAKSAKQLKEAVVGEDAQAEPMNDGQSDRTPELVAPAAASAPAKAAAKSTRKRTSGAATKKAAPAKPRKVAARKRATPAEAAVSDDDIRLRAYFIAEKRSQMGGSGDSSSDWMEARRQLLAEAGGRA